MRTPAKRRTPRISRAATAAGLVVAASSAVAEPSRAQDARAANTAAAAAPAPGASGRSIDARAGRTWVRIEPGADEIHAYEMEPRDARDRARVEAFVARHPELAGSTAEK